MGNDARAEILWKLIVARDKTLAGAHQLSEISLLEKEEEISEKEVEIRRLKRDAEERMEVIKRLHDDIDQLKRSYYYRLGHAFLYPVVVVRKLLWRRG